MVKKERRLHVYSIALQNIKVRKVRTILMMFFVFLMSSSFFFCTVLMQNMNKSIENTKGRMGADMIVVPEEGTEEIRESLFSGKPCTVYFEKEWEDRIRKIDGVKRATPQLYVATLGASCCDAPVQMIAIDPQTDFVVKPWLEEQHNIELRSGEVLVGYNIAVGADNTVKFYDTEFRVAGKLEKSGMGYDDSVFMSFDTIYRLEDSEIARENLDMEDLEKAASMVMVETEDETSLAMMKFDIEDAYPENEKVYACTADDLMSGYARQIDKLSGYGGVLAVLLFISTALALICIFVITMNERRHEFGIFYTLGARKGHLAGIIVWEALIISLCGALLGIVVAGAGIFLFRNLLSVKFEIPYLEAGLQTMLPAALVCLCIALATGLLAALCSAAQIGRNEPYRLIRENG